MGTRCRRRRTAALRNVAVTETRREVARRGCHRHHYVYARAFVSAPSRSCQLPTGKVQRRYYLSLYMYLKSGRIRRSRRVSAERASTTCFSVVRTNYTKYATERFAVILKLISPSKGFSQRTRAPEPRKVQGRKKNFEIPVIRSACV